MGVRAHRTTGRFGEADQPAIGPTHRPTDHPLRGTPAMERWTFLVIAGPDDEPAQIRVLLRSGDDPAAWPAAQIGLDGTDRPVDQAAHDYEAPEWKAAQLLDEADGQRRCGPTRPGQGPTAEPRPRPEPSQLPGCAPLAERVRGESGRLIGPYAI